MTAPFILLDDARAGHERLSRFSGFERTITARDETDVGPALDALARARDDGLHAVGYFAYELGYALEPRLAKLMPSHLSLPLIWFALFKSREDLTGPAAASWWETLAPCRAYAGPLRYGETADSYGAKFRVVEDYIRAGDAYQVNLTFPARFAFAGDPLALYARLRASARAGFGAYIADGERCILSLSPELFFSLSDGVLTARPMKGTAPRGIDSASDAGWRARLATNPKDRAENLMIVDLIRNDLGRVARTGTVNVEELFAIETYPTVHQMVSTVRADMRDGVKPADIVRALFPCGSITGAPKFRTMEIIGALEESPRGLYCGAVGNFSPDGSAAFNVAIRTLIIDEGEGVLGLGGGVVADSQAGSEYEECLLKARFFSVGRPPLSLIETLRFELGTGYTRFSLHMTRLARSARALGFPFDEAAIRRAFESAAKDSATLLRVRLQLNEDGRFDIALSPYRPVTPETRWTYAVSDTRIDGRDALLRHKTNWRDLYDGEYERLQRSLGCDEVLFLNRSGELTEGSRTNIFVRKDGILITPPLESGLLDGCLRRALVDNGACIERVLTLADLDAAEAVYFGNSLRGLIPGLPVLSKNE